ASVIVDDEAFKSENPEAADIYDTPINFNKYQHMRKMTLKTALRLALKAVPTNNATFVVMRDQILITTFLECEPISKLNEKVQGAFDKRPLRLVLRELSESTGATIVVDKRAADKANTEITVHFVNDIDLAGAVRIATEMADLKALVLDGAIF